MSRLVILCGEALLLADDAAPPKRAVVSEAAAEAVARLTAASVVAVLVSDFPAFVGGGGSSEAALAHLHGRIRDGLARRSARLEAIIVPSAPLAAAFAAALARFRGVPGATPVLCDSMAALEAAATLGCPRILVRTRAGRAVQAAGIPERLLPVGVQADLAAAVEPALRLLR